MLVEILSVVAAGFESGGISGAAFAIPPATLAAMGRVPGLVFNLNAVAFAISVGLFLLTTPILVVTARQCITSLSAVGPVRKTLSFLLVLVLWWAVQRPRLGKMEARLFSASPDMALTWPAVRTP